MSTNLRSNGYISIKERLEKNKKYHKILLYTKLKQFHYAISHDLYTALFAATVILLVGAGAVTSGTDGFNLPYQRDVNDRVRYIAMTNPGEIFKIVGQSKKTEADWEERRIVDLLQSLDHERDYPPDVEVISSNNGASQAWVFVKISFGWSKVQILSYRVYMDIFERFVPVYDAGGEVVEVYGVDWRNLPYYKVIDGSVDALRVKNAAIFRLYEDKGLVAVEKINKTFDAYLELFIALLSKHIIQVVIILILSGVFVLLNNYLVKVKTVKVLYSNA